MKMGIITAIALSMVIPTVAVAKEKRIVITGTVYKGGPDHGKVIGTYHTRLNPQTGTQRGTTWGDVVGSKSGTYAVKQTRTINIYRDGDRTADRVRTRNVGFNVRNGERIRR